MKRMIWNEIRKRYPDEWVLLAEPETVKGLKIKAGIPIAHSANRSEIYRKQRSLEGDYAILFTGEIAKDKVFVL